MRFDNKEIIELLKIMGFEHEIENGFHCVEGHGFSYRHIGLLNIVHRIGHYLKFDQAAEIERLKRQNTDLQENNTKLVLENRRFKALEDAVSKGVIRQGGTLYNPQDYMIVEREIEE